MTMAGNVIEWSCNGIDLRIGLDRAGAGPTVLLLPALSSISTRSEMQPLQERLAHSFTTVAVDWPGFGCQSKPFVDWQPQVYDTFLAHLLTHVVPSPFATIAAGHAAGYVIRHVARHKGAMGRLVLLSPTWRGPLPTVAGGHRPIFGRITGAVDLPVIGWLLYRLNVNRFTITMMGRGHVYADPAWLTGRRLGAKLTVTRTPGARHASARFVTGCLDPFRSRKEQLGAARRSGDPMLNLFAETAPRKSKAEMEALAALSSVQTVRLPAGKLSVYEEFPDEVASVVREFLTVASTN
jgi:pimeloyl-ACP methyl ester carboxylesterase